MSKEIQEKFELISDLVNYLNNPNLNVQELAKFLTLKTFHLYGAYAVFFMKLNPNASLELIANFGQPDEQTEGWKVVSLSHDLPATDAVKEDRMIWLADHNDWAESYPHLIEYPDSTELRSLINVPTYVTGAPIGVMGIMCDKEVRPSPEDISFVEIISGLVSLHLSKSISKHALLEDRGAYLTKRQIIILEMMSQQMTNMQIAKELGYSESTIRHETMRIYELLQASGRREAVVLARKLNLIK